MLHQFYLHKEKKQNPKEKKKKGGGGIEECLRLSKQWRKMYA